MTALVPDVVCVWRCSADGRMLVANDTLIPKEGLAMVSNYWTRKYTQTIRAYDETLDICH